MPRDGQKRKGRKKKNKIKERDRLASLSHPRKTGSCALRELLPVTQQPSSSLSPSISYYPSPPPKQLGIHPTLVTAWLSYQQDHSQSSPWASTTLVPFALSPVPTSSEDTVLHSRFSQKKQIEETTLVRGDNVESFGSLFNSFLLIPATFVLTFFKLSRRVSFVLIVRVSFGGCGLLPGWSPSFLSPPPGASVVVAINKFLSLVCWHYD